MLIFPSIDFPMTAIKFLRFFWLFLLNFSLVAAGAAQHPITKIHPPFWYSNMHWSQLQILLYGKNISQWTPSVTGQGVTLLRQVRTENPNYLIVYLDVAQAPPQTCTLWLRKEKTMHPIPYELKPRTLTPADIVGFEPGDVFYLIMPDRFANGDPTNDIVPGLREAKVDRSQPGARHGGDLLGIIKHLPYIKELGATGLWLNPVLINDEAQFSYHGYAATDLYEVDPRFGTNELYVLLVREAHRLGLKVIKDVIYNHVSTRNFLVNDLISKNWIHTWPQFTRCSYRPSTRLDPYVSDFDYRVNDAGWFDHHMADLNQSDSLLADYLIQHTLWWIELAGLDGLRIDTYPYVKQEFLHRLIAAVRTEYPRIGIVGEIWDAPVANVAYFQQGSPLNKGNGGVEYVFDFNLQYALRDGLRESFGWNTGLRRIYYTLVQDLLYGDPNKLVTFLDNHDLSRIYSELGEDFNKWRQAVVLLFTLRGLPCVYYGTELLFTGFTNPDGLVRQDFPGGWPGDAYNKFTETGRSAQEQQAFEFMRKLIQLRKQYTALQQGATVHFVPDDELYWFFRFDQRDTLLVAINTSHQIKSVPYDRVAPWLEDFTHAIEVISGDVHANLRRLEVHPLSASLWLLR